MKLEEPFMNMYLAKEQHSDTNTLRLQRRKKEKAKFYQSNNKQNRRKC